ncbi:NAD(P)-binding protein [Amycolatopsis rubida]|uniref:NAD(P)-binding protein n=1 Tax=Amycolatopsis rubida TaxID=112413 RepID=A0ABX0C8D6_9PSEU|nr:MULTISPECIES: FAD-dependent monooxygenase [Amycolatopsis]MYW96192.1 NAD(P)-binding protein [Amycolatopsis rubida]NEC61183.1 NAD(P)-binding protein [Amycolatopsis rubida]OAP24292.1 3-hydroxybenzoate 6-hydroxylase 1 [Amycolatopsis sp. M39]
MPRHTHTVTIAGGGLGGLTAALALRHRGMQVTVLEQAPELAEVGAGIQTAPNASRVLLGLGLRPRLELIRTEPTDQVRRRWKDGSIIASRPLGATVWRDYGAPYWHFHRADLHRVLLDACLDPAGPGPAVELHTASPVADVDFTDETTPTAVTEDGRRFPADIVIGADGLRSAVRRALGLDTDLVFSGEMVYRAMIPGDKIAADPATRFLMDQFHSTLWYGPKKHLVHYLIRGGEYLNVGAAVPNTIDTTKNWTEPATVDEMTETFADWDDRITSILSKAEGTPSKWAVFAQRRNPVWTYGHTALLGDACHAMLPFQAQGASQAIEDAAVLAEELATATTANIPTALLNYVNRRATHAGMVQDASAQNKHLYQLDDGPEQQERDRKLRTFEGESDVSYDWLWRGTPLNGNTTTHTYSFARR